MNENLHIERIWLNNHLRNYNYIAVCKSTSEALVIDPTWAKTVLDILNKNNWKLKAIVNTHNHDDHIAGNSKITSTTGAPIYAPRNSNISQVSRWLVDGDTIEFGDGIVFTVMDTPGHTHIHQSLLSNTREASLFCGDTIFNAGAGNVYSGNAKTLFDTFESKLQTLNEDTKLYPGHDYMQTNLEFALDLLPDDEQIRSLLVQVKQQNPEERSITTMGQEKLINPFLRLTDDKLIQRLIDKDPILRDNSDKEHVFLKLRELRNNW